MIRVNRLSYRIGEHRIIDDLSLDLLPSSYYALAGENGAGKSTLIRIILDLIRNADSQEISIGGRDNKLLNARQQLSYLPEKFDIKREVSGVQYLRFVSDIYRQPYAEDRIGDLSEQLNFDMSRLGDKTFTYSKGMKQKLGLISCFMLDLPLIILDEPLTGLDPTARFRFKQLLLNERKHGRSIFYSTHLLADAEEICDQFGILHRGRIVFDGTPQQCLQQFQQDTLEKAYIQCLTTLPTVQFSG